MEKHLFTSESVTEGHPDKMCDQISDAILDALMTADGRTAVREFIDAGDFTKKAGMEKLELSRRYWTALGISDWKLIISGESIAKQTGGAS